MHHIILDTETTGLDPATDKIVEIGAVELVDYAPTGRTYHTYLNPGIPVPAEATEVHGLTDAFLADKPKFQQIAADFISFVGTATLVAHNAPFDMGFLQAELAGCGLPQLGNQVIDTLALARTRHPGARHDLDSLCKRYGISTAHRTTHGALLDAELLARVYVELVGRQGALELAVAPVTTAALPAEIRQRTLPIRLTAAEIEAHAAMVAAIPGSIWPTLAAANSAV